jgi:hypothetical protein
VILEYLRAHIAWSRLTFGIGLKTVSITRHIKKELDEIAANPTDLVEWIDVIILGFDGAWRAGHTPEQIISALQHKQSVNFGRQWQTPANPDEPVEHIREEA